MKSHKERRKGSNRSGGNETQYDFKNGTSKIHLKDVQDSGISQGIIKVIYITEDSDDKNALQKKVY